MAGRLPDTRRIRVETARRGGEGADNEGMETLDSPVNFGLGEYVPQASREPAGRGQWAEHRLEAVRKGKVGQSGVTDHGWRSREFGDQKADNERMETWWAGRSTSITGASGTAAVGKKSVGSCA